MRITKCRINLPEHRSPKNLLALVDMVLENSLAIKEMRLLENKNQQWILTMPSRPLHGLCSYCHCPVPYFYKYCGYCGKSVPKDKRPEPPINPVNGRKMLFVDHVHPVNSDMREAMTMRAIEAYEDVLDQQDSSIVDNMEDEDLETLVDHESVR
jgi:DNA-binding cell septation regulator SpoVG